jgi:hypothetical protein
MVGNTSATEHGGAVGKVISMSNTKAHLCREDTLDDNGID